MIFNPAWRTMVYAGSPAWEQREAWKSKGQRRNGPDSIDPRAKERQQGKKQHVPPVTSAVTCFVHWPWRLMHKSRHDRLSLDMRPSKQPNNYQLLSDAVLLWTSGRAAGTTSIALSFREAGCMGQGATDIRANCQTRYCLRAFAQDCIRKRARKTAAHLLPVEPKATEGFTNFTRCESSSLSPRITKHTFRSDISLEAIFDRCWQTAMKWSSKSIKSNTAYSCISGNDWQSHPSANNSAVKHTPLTEMKIFMLKSECRLKPYYIRVQNARNGQNTVIERTFPKLASILDVSHLQDKINTVNKRGDGHGGHDALFQPTYKCANLQN